MTPVKNPFDASPQTITYAEPQPMTQATPSNGKVKRKVKDAKQLDVQPQPQAPIHPAQVQAAQSVQQLSNQAQALTQGALASVKSNVVELSACGGWGLVVSMLIKATLPVTQNLWGFTCVCLLVGHWLTKAAAPPRSILWRRVAWTLVGAAVAGFFRLTPQIAVPEQFNWFFNPTIEQTQGEGQG